MATRPLTDRQERFIHEYLIDHNASAAAVRAGYSAKTKGTQAAELLKDDRICERIAVELSDLFAQLKVNALDLMRRQLNLADLDPGKLFDDDEEAIPLKELDEDTKRALTVSYEKRRGVTVTKVRQTPRHIALAALWRRFDVMAKMRERAFERVEQGREEERAGSARMPAPAAAPRVPAFDIATSPVALNLRRICEEARARQAREQAARAREGALTAQVAGEMEAALVPSMEEEAQARLREAEEEAERTQAELAGAMAQVRSDESAGEVGPPEVVEVREVPAVAAEGSEASLVAADGGEVVVRMAEDSEVRPMAAEGNEVSLAAADEGEVVAGMVEHREVPPMAAEGCEAPAEVARARVDEVAVREAAGDEASQSVAACALKGGLALEGSGPAASGTRLEEDAAYERERAAREQAREAELERDMARLLGRGGRPGDAGGNGPAAWRKARAVAQGLVQAARAKRELLAARAASMPRPKATPEPEMKPSLLEHLQRVRRKEQSDELLGNARAGSHSGRIAPGLVIGGGRRPPGYNPPWERNDRPRYADGREFEWSV